MNFPYDETNSAYFYNSVQGYQPPYQYNAYALKLIRDPSKNWAAVTGFVAGIVSIFIFLGYWIYTFFFWEPIVAELMNVLYYSSILGGILGIIFSSIGLRSEQRKMAIVGLICAIGSFIIQILLPFMIVFYLLLSF